MAAMRRINGVKELPPGRPRPGYASERIFQSAVVALLLLAVALALLSLGWIPSFGAIPN